MQRLVSILLALLLVATGVAYAMHVEDAERAGTTETEEAGHGGDGHDHDHGASSKEARLARASEGKVPDLADLATLERHGTIALRPDSSWSPASGVDGGLGTPEDPYVIDGVYADVLYVGDTAVEFEVRNSYIRTLVLDWHGDHGLVHHNRILEMRTNRNVERTGDPSAAVIVHNVIDRIVELRHFDGVVAHNVIGRSDVNAVKNDVVFDFAGFNGAEVHDNVVFGGVDIKLHGHHHGDAPCGRVSASQGTCSGDDGTGRSHNHGAPDAQQAEAHAEDHAARHHRLDFHDNVIVDPLGFGLRYNDRDHAGDDRTATSEQEPTLEATHVHFTHVTIRDNVVDGGPIKIDVFNAPDEYHADGQRGELQILRNRVVNATLRDGILLGAVADADVLVEGNRVEHALGVLGQSGIRAIHLQNSTLAVVDNVVDGFRTGIAAQDFDANTTWTLDGNRVTGAQRDVWWDESVANPPEGDASHAGHEHDEAAVARLDDLL